MEDFNGVIGILFQKTEPVKYALMHNIKTGNVTFPGGGREGNETSEQNLIREIREETGLLPKDYQITSTKVIHEFVYNKKKAERVGQTARQFVYLIKTSKTALTPKDPDSEFMGWFTEKETLEKLTFPDSKELFKKAIKYI